MIAAPVPKNEDLRLEALCRLNLLDSLPDPRLDAITKFTAQSLHAPICLITLVDSEHQWYKSSFGVDSKEGPRETSICAHAIYGINSDSPFDRTFEVRDTKNDRRFCDSPIVVGPPFIRSYLGYVLRTDTGMNIGTLCIDDTAPRKFSDLN